MRRPKTLRERIETRIARKRGEDVFLTREFRDLGGEDQVLRVLRTLVREKRLVRLGYGVYGRAIVSRLSGDPILYSQNGFLGAARQALTKLGVKWEPSEAERDYNAGRSTQIPVNPGCAGQGAVLAPAPRRQAGAGACPINRLSRICSKFKGISICQVQRWSRRTGMSSRRSRRSTPLTRSRFVWCSAAARL